jgi:AGZA family xanthine/uracil permease-like MFS transporter
VAGFTTFLTMAYIIIINPAILEVAGIPPGPSMTATILSAGFGTLIMGFYAKRPFAIAPYMGENAFIAYTVVKVLGFPWQTALGAIFLAGAAFTLLTLLGIRGWLANAIPLSLKFSLAVGIGLFLTFIGLNETGLVVLGVPGAPVALGDFHTKPVLLALAGLLLMGWLLARRIRGAIILGILAVTLCSIALGVTPAPHALASLPPSLHPILGQMDIRAALTLKALPVVIMVFIMAFLDTVGTLIGLSARAGLLDERGNLPEIEKPMLADALANLIAPILGTTTSGAYIESAAGIEEGGRTGFTALVTAGCFFLALFFVPLFTIVPAHACGVALIMIGMLMVSPVAKLNFTDYTELIPSLLTIILISFTYNIGVGMTAGLLAYPLLKLLTGRVAEVSLPMWLLAAASLTYYLVYPHASPS